MSREKCCPLLLDSMLQDSDFAFYSINPGLFGGRKGSIARTDDSSEQKAASPYSNADKYRTQSVSARGSAPHHRSTMSRDDSFLDSFGKDPGSHKEVFAEADVNRRPRHCHRRHNTTSTMFVTDHMCAPDRDGTITCVCTVIRAHLKEAHTRLYEGGGDLDSATIKSR
jgi:hypothetical protein